MEMMMGIPKTYTVIAIGICGTVYTSIVRKIAKIIVLVELKLDG